MLSYVYLSILYFAMTVSAYGQINNNVRQNQIMVELLGNGGTISLNYERTIFEKLAARAGFGYFTIIETASERGSTSDGYTWMPTGTLILSYLVGEGSYKMEAGGGIFTHLNKNNACKGPFSKSCSPTGFTGILGYRHQPLKGGFTFRFAVTPFYDFQRFIISLGASFGWTF